MVPEALQRRLEAAGLRLADLQITFSRSSGPGGQHVNKVSTAVTVRHVPTGIMVTASDSRSQSMNRQLALGRMAEHFEKQRAEKRQARLAAAARSRRQKASRSRGTKLKMIESKRRRGEMKKLRGRVSGNA